jgi:mannose-1-phosphate guanylyltransferase
MEPKDYRNHLYGLILAGGGGTRLWPKSLERTPKQFLRLFGRKTLMEITADRLRSFLPWERIFIVTTTSAYGTEIKRLLPDLPHKNLVVEPMRRDSGPAHALGARIILLKDQNAIIINAAADQFVSPVKRYRHAMYAAAKAANENDCLVAVGIRPQYPHTGLGHIKKGKRIAIEEGKAIFKLDKFVEKPPLALAKKYTDSGEYFWNAAHYVWRADTFLTALGRYAPDIASGIEVIGKAIGTDKEKEVIEREYKKMPKISVDYAVSEKAKNFLMLVADYNWTDIGDWNEVWKNLSKDDAGNVLITENGGNPDVITIDTSDTLIHCNGRMVAVVDVDNMVIVDTPNALLICNKSHAQDVKKIVEQLKNEGRKELL